MVRGIINGGINPNPQLQRLEDNTASVLLDGDRGLGHLVGVRAMNIAVEKAKSASIGVAIVRNSNHFGAASSHAMRAVEHDMIGFATTNGLGVNVAVFGARSTSIGNNALSFAIPAGEEPPIVLDMACGAAAAGRIGTARLYQEKIPLGWDWMQMAMKPMTPGRLLLFYLRRSQRLRTCDRDGYLMRSVEWWTDGYQQALSAWRRATRETRISTLFLSRSTSPVSPLL